MSTTALQTIQHRIGGAGDERLLDAHRARLRSDDRRPRRTPRSCSRSTQDVDAAVPGRGSGAFESLGRRLVTRRARVMFKFRELVDHHTDELTRIISPEHGKALADATGEVTRGIEVVDFACGRAAEQGRVLPPGIGRRRCCSLFRQPLGVCAGVTPFNFPVMVPLWMQPMALACGNTFVLKPSERDPSRVSNLDRRTLRAGGAPRTAYSTSSTAKGLGRRADRTPGGGAVSFVGSTPDRQVRLRRAPPQTASECRHSAARKTTRS